MPMHRNISLDTIVSVATRERTFGRDCGTTVEMLGTALSAGRLGSSQGAFSVRVEIADPDRWESENGALLSSPSVSFENGNLKRPVVTVLSESEMGAALDGFAYTGGLERDDPHPGRWARLAAE